MSAEVKQLHKCIETTGEFNFEIRTSIADVYFPHYHNCYELSHLAAGSLIYTVNGESMRLQSGTLLFTRPSDVHFKQAVSPEIKLLNITFHANILETLCQYLGVGFDIARLENEKYSPMTHVGDYQTKEIVARFEEILHTKDAEIQTTKLRILLFYLLTTYFMDPPQQETVSENLWLVGAMKEMEQENNFVEGMPALLRITGKTHAHICRTMSKMFGVTPSQFINNLRLSHAESLLLHTDMDVLSISIESGFNSLSNFYTSFEKRFGSSPLQYKKQWVTSLGLTDKLTQQNQ